MTDKAKQREISKAKSRKLKESRKKSCKYYRDNPEAIKGDD